MAVNDKEFSVTLSMYFSVRWDEPRFETNNTVKEDQWTPIDLQFMNQLWVPNIFIYDLRRLQDTSKPIASIFAKSEIECTIYGANLYLSNEVEVEVEFRFLFFYTFVNKIHEMFPLWIRYLQSKLCNQVPSLSLSRWRTLTLLKISRGCVFLCFKLKTIVSY